ncbi:hypothetical protein Tco_0022772 [Tanacetum coccineum]
MKRASKGYTRENIPLFPAMIIQGPVVQGKGSTHLVESHHTPTSAPSTSQPLISPTSRRINKQESVVPQPRSPTQFPIADEAAFIGVDVRYGGATTSVTSLKAEQGSGRPLPRPMIHLSQELTHLEVMRVLIKKVKKLENKVKSSQARRRAIIIISDDEDDLEDPSKQGRKIAEIGQDPTISLDVSTAKKDVSTAKPVSTASAAITTASVAVSTAKDKGKAKMDESESKTTQTKTKLQQEQERLCYEAAVRLQAELEEEERQRIARVHEAASSFIMEEWEEILLASIY